MYFNCKMSMCVMCLTSVSKWRIKQVNAHSWQIGFETDQLSAPANEPRLLRLGDCELSYGYGEASSRIKHQLSQEANCVSLLNAQTVHPQIGVLPQAGLHPSTTFRRIRAWICLDSKRNRTCSSQLAVPALFSVLGL